MSLVRERPARHARLATFRTLFSGAWIVQRENCARMNARIGSHPSTTQVLASAVYACGPQMHTHLAHGSEAAGWADARMARRTLRRGQPCRVCGWGRRRATPPWGLTCHRRSRASTARSPTRRRARTRGPGGRSRSAGKTRDLAPRTPRSPSAVPAELQAQPGGWASSPRERRRMTARTVRVCAFQLSQGMITKPLMVSQWAQKILVALNWKRESCSRGPGWVGPYKCITVRNYYHMCQVKKYT